MVRAWYLDESKVAKNQKDPAMTEKLVTLQELKQIGVEYFEFDADSHENNEKYISLKKERGYNYSDQLTVSRETLPGYDEKVKHFFEEHMHKDEEIRYILDGSGYFDVRDVSDKWIRIELVKNDLIVLPAGIYHRFTLDQNDYIEVIRLFIGEPVWTPYNRPADQFPERISYVTNFGVKCN